MPQFYPNHVPVSIQLISLASRGSNKVGIPKAKIKVSIQLISLASRGCREKPSVLPTNQGFHSINFSSE